MFKYKTIETHARAFLPLNISAVGSVEFFILKSYVPLKEIPANLPGQLSSSGQIFLHWAAATLKGHIGFQNKKF